MCGGVRGRPGLSPYVAWDTCGRHVVVALRDVLLLMGRVWWKVALGACHVSAERSLCVYSTSGTLAPRHVCAVGGCPYIAIFSEARRSGAIFGGGPPWAPRHVTSLGAGADAVECRMRPRMQQEKACWRARKPAPAFAI